MEASYLLLAGQEIRIIAGIYTITSSERGRKRGDTKNIFLILPGSLQWQCTCTYEIMNLIKMYFDLGVIVEVELMYRLFYRGLRQNYIYNYVKYIWNCLLIISCVCIARWINRRWNEE